MERLDLQQHQHAERQRWRNGGEWEQGATKVAVGELPDGRWYARWYTLGAAWPAYVYGPEHGEWYARRTAGRWKRRFGGTWVEAG